jgi:hypothetical protein
MTVLKTKSPGDRLLPRKVVSARYCRGPKTLARWSNDPEVDFPAPVDIRGLKYYREAELNDWDRRRSATSSKSRASTFPYAKQPEPV